MNVLKLDRALTSGIEPECDVALYRAVVGLCAELGIDVVAEGVVRP